MEKISKKGDLQKEIANSIGMEFILIQPGAFIMGSNEYDSEKSPHKVKISKPFYMGKYPVTQEQWEKVIGSNPSYFNKEKVGKVGKDTSKHPVESVSWYDVQEFIKKLNAMESPLTPLNKGGIKGGILNTGGTQGEGNTEGTQGLYRLPTEAEWEYCCRAYSLDSTLKKEGQEEWQWCFGNDEKLLEQYAWYDKNSEGTTYPVGLLNPNAWGLYDILGNVWEWCEDWYGWYGEYPNGDVIDPKGPDRGRYRVLRGGSWAGSSASCRSADRDCNSPDLRNSSFGFRLVRII